MSKAFFPVSAIFLTAWSSLGATPAKPKKRHHTATAAASSTHAPKHTAGATKAAPHQATKTKAARASGGKTSATKTSAHRKGKIAHSPARSYQQAPTPDRYKDIQQALASKGYFQGEANGEWGPESADALKRFQTEQSLMPDGKINSLSLIALGLGPKRLTAKSDSAPQPGTPAPPPANPPQ